MEEDRYSLQPTDEDERYELEDEYDDAGADGPVLGINASHAIT